VKARLHSPLFFVTIIALAWAGLVELALAQQSDSRKIPGWEQNIDPPEPPPRADTSNALDSINAGFAASVRSQRLSLSFGRGWVLGFEALSRTE